MVWPARRDPGRQAVEGSRFLGRDGRLTFDNNEKFKKSRETENLEFKCKKIDPFANFKTPETSFKKNVMTSKLEAKNDYRFCGYLKQKICI